MVNKFIENESNFLGFFYFYALNYFRLILISSLLDGLKANYPILMFNVVFV